MIEVAGIKFYTLAEIPEPDRSYMLPWTPEMLYEIEPSLRGVVETAVAKRRCRFQAKHEAYSTAKNEAFKLVGWGARDPRLRNSGAWDCLFRYILDELNI